MNQGKTWITVGHMQCQSQDTCRLNVAVLVYPSTCTDSCKFVTLSSILLYDTTFILALSFMFGTIISVLTQIVR